jgi:sugar phosphate isomerase/epimerase
MNSSNVDGTGIETIEEIQPDVCDYLELPLAQIMALDDYKFNRILDLLKKHGFKCEACNNFFPPNIRLTGETINWQEIDNYVEKALKRATRLGAKVIVFGSSGARNVPTNFPTEKAFAQIKELVSYLSEKLVPCGIMLAIEPLNRGESNIINTTLEAFKLLESKNYNNVGLDVDLYHFKLEKEDYDNIDYISNKILHVHIANTKDRSILLDKEETRKFMYALKKNKYDRRISVEAYSKDVKPELPLAIYLLKEIEKEYS